MKKVLSIFIVSLYICTILCFNSFAFVNTKIDDSADLFSDSEEASINNNLLDFSIETNYPAIVLTTDDATGKTSQDFADDYFDNLIIYSGWDENGILFLVDMDNREVCISTMGECISVYADYIDYIIDSGFDELLNGNYSECFNLMISAALDCYQGNYYDDYYVDDYYGDYPIDDEYYYENIIQSENSSVLSNVFVCIVISLVIGAVSVLFVKNSYKNMGKGDEFDADDLILTLTDSDDTVISRNVITTRVPKNNNHNRSGGSGGGSSHHSSGGFSHGGGSRKF